MVALRLLTAPTEEPVSLEEAKDHLRVVDAEEDGLIGRQAKAARRWCEVFTRRQFCTATWILYHDGFPPWRADYLPRTAQRERETILLPRGPLQAVSSVKYLRESDAAEQTLVAGTDYNVDQYGEPARVEPAYGATWPSARRIANSVYVQYVAGYGAASAVPDDIKHAILIVLEDLHLNRGDVVTGTIVNNIGAAKALLWPHRILSLDYMEAA